MGNVDAHLWLGVVEAKLESIHSNKVWELVEIPKGIKSIRCEWVYKRKSGVNEKVETYKARLITKVYSKKIGFNYEKTFL